MLPGHQRLMQGQSECLPALTGMQRQSPPGSRRLGKRGRPVSIHLLAGKTTKQSAAHRGGQYSQEKCLSTIHPSVHPPLDLPHVYLCLFLSSVHLCHVPVSILVSTICHISFPYLSKYTCAHTHTHTCGRFYVSHSKGVKNI